MGYLQVNDSSPEEGKTLTVIFRHSPWPNDAWEVKRDAHSHDLIPPSTCCALPLHCLRAAHFIPTGSQCSISPAPPSPLQSSSLEGFKSFVDVAHGDMG